MDIQRSSYTKKLIKHFNIGKMVDPLPINIKLIFETLNIKKRFDQ